MGKAKPYTHSDGILTYKDTIFKKGLRFTNNQESMVTDSFLGKPDIVLGVDGAETIVRFGGYMNVHTSGFALFSLTNGGKFVLTKDARLDFLSAWYTRQIWVRGDGTGTLEIGEGFTADRTKDGTIKLAVGAYRISNARLIIKSQSGQPQYWFETSGLNGHLVFEDQPGGVLIIDGEDQIYDAAVWIDVDMAVDTRKNFTHRGEYAVLTGAGYEYGLASAFQFRKPNITVTKQGAADLILAGEQAYRVGSRLLIIEGAVRFKTDAVGGVFTGNDYGTQELGVRIMDSGALICETTHLHLKKLNISGSGRVCVRLGDTIHIDTNTVLDGTLTVSADGVLPQEGEWKLFDWSGVEGQFANVELPAAFGNWDISRLYTDGVVSAGGGSAVNHSRTQAFMIRSPRTSSAHVRIKDAVPFDRISGGRMFDIRGRSTVRHTFTHAPQGVFIMTPDATHEPTRTE
ncbi:MAG: hypothetical protein GF344_08075 [Chitinivibrionales bacterium]|nr:hypothetical protein [Chitinivibrionales bacterium]MBD3356847.1 hypothetical protein [Chitinivibrionales bacterium]